jgi:hypothetical protein
MNNLPNNTTVDGKKIISEDNKNDHRHDSSQIQGLSEDAIGNAFVYAEFIDGVSYSQLQSEFISNTNNVMSGNLIISSNSLTENNIINVLELNNLKNNNGISDYDITSLPITEEVNNNTQSIMVSGAVPSIDMSWTTIGSGNVTENISLTGPNISSGGTYTFEITNYNSFNAYSVSISEGSATINSNGTISVTAPQNAPNQQTITMTVSNDTLNVDKVVTMTLVEDPDMNITYSRDNNLYYQIPSSGINIDTQDSFYLRLENYNSAYNYTTTASIAGFSFSQSNDTITVTPPSDNNTTQTVTLTVDRGDDTFNIILNLVPFDQGWDLKGFTGTAYGIFNDTSNTDDVKNVMFMNNDGTKLYVYGYNNQATLGILERNLSVPYDITTAGSVVATHVDTIISSNHDPRGIIVSSDGKVLTIMSGEFGEMAMISYDTPWNFNGGNRVGYGTPDFLLGSNFDSEDIYPRCISMSDDGAYFHVLFYDDSIGSVDLAEYSLSVNYFVGSATLNNRRNLDTNVQRLDFMTNFMSPSGDKMVFKRYRASGESYLSWYTLSVPYDISSSIQVRATEVSTNSLLTNYSYNAISPDGQNLFVISDANDSIYPFKI